MTHIVRWKPFEDLASLQGRIDRLFGETFGRLQSDAGEGFERSTWAPAVDTLETDEALVLRADLPGMDANDVDIEVNDNVLTLRGERKFEKDVKEDNFHRVERAFGAFVRSFTLPRTVDADKIDAHYNRGVLEIRLPKRPEARPRQIKVAVSNS